MATMTRTDTAYSRADENPLDSQKVETALGSAQVPFAVRATIRHAIGYTIQADITLDFRANPATLTDVIEHFLNSVKSIRNSP